LPSPASPAAELWLYLGAITGDTARSNAYDAAAAQLALKAAVAGNDLAASALGPLDRIDAADGMIRAAQTADLQNLAGLDALPDDAPESIANLYSVLRPLRIAADQGLAGGGAA
jgi:hypothetical protein